MTTTGLPDARIRLILDTSQTLSAATPPAQAGPGAGGGGPVDIDAEIRKRLEAFSKETDAEGKRSADQMREGDRGGPGAAARYLQYKGIDSVGRSFGRSRTGHRGRGAVSRVPIPIVRRARATLNSAWQQAAATGRQVAKVSGVGATGATVIPGVGAALYVAGKVADPLEVAGGILEQAGVSGAAGFGTDAANMFRAISGKHIIDPVVRHLAALFKDVPAAKQSIAAVYGHEPEQMTIDSILQKKKWARERQENIDTFQQRHARFNKASGMLRMFSELGSLVQ